jgi:hypothetical protein
VAAASGVAADDVAGVDDTGPGTAVAGAAVERSGVATGATGAQLATVRMRTAMKNAKASGIRWRWWDIFATP